ncbi:DDE-type integrase/transposase/recombinase [Methylomonas sp. 2BW1-5-20]|uniref:DDE-type integrase/transposase/recombinase n=1 Tax=Methylomonas sp. 2BW1-5-20 TaxID=3376686 RepID=UPI00404D149B
MDAPKGQWLYLYRAIDKFGDTIDFMLSEHRDDETASWFFKQAFDNNGLSNRVVIDQGGSSEAGLNK